MVAKARMRKSGETIFCATRYGNVMASRGSVIPLFIDQMKKNILTNPSFRYIFEVFIIVFSVTVSFYIQEVINKKEKIELKNKALKGVLMELKSDVSNFNNASSILKASL